MRLRRDTRDVLSRNRSSHQRQRRYREGLCRPAFLSRNLALGNRPLFNRKERLAGKPIEDEYKAGLGRLCDGGNVAAVSMHRHEDWLTGGVIVP